VRAFCDERRNKGGIPLGQINRYSIVATETVAIRLDGGSRTIIRAEGNDVRIAYQRDLFDLGQYFDIKDGEVFVFDPNTVTGTTAAEMGTLFYATVDVGDTATLSVWLQGETQGA